MSYLARTIIVLSVVINSFSAEKVDSSGLLLKIDSLYIMDAGSMMVFSAENISSTKHSFSQFSLVNSLGDLTLRGDGLHVAFSKRKNAQPSPVGFFDDLIHVEPGTSVVIPIFVSKHDPFLSMAASFESDGDKSSRRISVYDISYNWSAELELLRALNGKASGISPTNVTLSGRVRVFLNVRALDGVILGAFDQAPSGPPE